MELITQPDAQLISQRMKNRLELKNSIFGLRSLLTSSRAFLIENHQLNVLMAEQEYHYPTLN